VSATAPDKSGTLPFTGQDLAFIVGTGSGLLLMGFGLRMMTRRHQTAP
jgi:hypothetical protein